MSKFSRKKYTDSELEIPKLPYVPLDTLSLDHSISAVANNLVLFCKSCKSLKTSSSEGGDKAGAGAYSGLLGVISKGIFQVYQLDVNSSQEGIAYELIQVIQTPNLSNPSVKPAISAAKWVRLRRHRKHITVLVLTSNVGINIFSDDGRSALCSVPFPEAVPPLLCRNIAATESQILIGNGRGEVNMFDFIDGKIQFGKIVQLQNELISEMCCRREILATGSSSGTLRVWRIKDHKALRRCTFKTPSEECVTGLGVWDNCLIATYGSGIFRIFHLGSKRLVARVMAHSRWIVSMDLLPHQGLLLTVAEDDAVLTWKLKRYNNHNKRSPKTARNSGTNVSNSQKRGRNLSNTKVHVELDAVTQTENMLLVGGKFLSCYGNVVALANYGVKEIYFYSRCSPQSFDC